MALELVMNLIEQLHQRQIRYCHWKSNTLIEDALEGVGDLDLLVSVEDKEKFEMILDKFNFIRAISPNENWFPGIYHYYGYDRESGKIIHIHLHYQLILGYDLLKNYHLPVEQPFLNNSFILHGISVPAFELELIVFVIRMVLKRRLLTLLLGHPKHLLKALIGKGRGPLSNSAQRELDFLCKRADLTKLEDFRNRNFSFIDDKLFEYCLSSISRTDKSLKWLFAGFRLSFALRQFKHFSHISALLVAITRRVRNCAKRIINLIGFKLWAKKRLGKNGKIIALVGGDGSGKSTNLKELNKWLGKKFDVYTIHLGKPKKCLLHFILSLYVRSLSRFSGNKTGNFISSIRFCLTARDRYKAFCKAKHMRSKGKIVLVDRFPISKITNMDSPQIRELTGGRGIYFFLAKTEEEYYKKIRGVDELIILRLDPKIASQRRPEDDPEGLSRRSGEIWNKQWPKGYAYVVDASLPLEKVKSQVKEISWRALTKKTKTIEMLGLAGSGKTTIANILREDTVNIQTLISFKRYKYHYVRSFLLSLPRFLHLFIQRVPFYYMKILFNSQAELDILKRNRDKQILDCSFIVLDQGPLLRLAVLECLGISGTQKSSIISWFLLLKKQAKDVLDAVVLLDASEEVLKKRINLRKKTHRMKNMSLEKTSEFFKEYRKSYDMLINDKENGSIPSVHLDTNTFTADEVAGQIAEILSCKSSSYVKIFD